MQKSFVPAIVSMLVSFSAQAAEKACYDLFAPNKSAVVVRRPVAFSSLKVATIENVFFSDTWPAPAFSKDSSLMVARALRKAGALHEPGILILNVKTGKKGFAPLPLDADSKPVAVEKIAISPLNDYAVLQAQGGHLTVVDLRTGQARHTRLQLRDQSTAFYPEFSFSEDGATAGNAYWIRQSGQVDRFNPQEFIEGGGFQDGIHTHLETLKRGTPYRTKQTRDWLIHEASGSYNILGFTSKQSPAKFVSSPVPGLYTVSSQGNVVIAKKENPDKSITIVMFDVDRLLAGDLPRVIWQSKPPASEFARYDISVLSDRSHLAIQDDNDAVVIETNGGVEKVRIVDYFKKTNTPNYRNQFIFNYENGFVFARTNPQILVRYNVRTGVSTELPLSLETDISWGPGGSRYYAAHVDVIHGSEGFVSVAKSSLSQVEAGIYDEHGLALKFESSDENRKGWSHSTPDGKTLIYTISRPDGSYETRVEKIAVKSRRLIKK